MPTGERGRRDGGRRRGEPVQHEGDERGLAELMQQAPQRRRGRLQRASGQRQECGARRRGLAAAACGGGGGVGRHARRRWRRWEVGERRQAGRVRAARAAAAVRVRSASAPGREESNTAHASSRARLAWEHSRTASLHLHAARRAPSSRGGSRSSTPLSSTSISRFTSLRKRQLNSSQSRERHQGARTRYFDVQGADRRGWAGTPERKQTCCRTKRHGISRIFTRQSVLLRLIAHLAPA